MEKECIQTDRAMDAKSEPCDAVNRDDFLKALNSVIQEAEAEGGKQGLTTWTLLAALAAIFWLSFNEVLDHNHSLAETLLVFVTAFYAGNFLRRLLGDKPRPRPRYQRFKTRSRYATIEALVFQAGGHPEQIPYLIVESIAIVSISIVLSTHGFLLVGLVIGILFVTIFIFLTLVFIATKIRLPLFRGHLTSVSRPISLVTNIVDLGILALLVCQTAVVHQPISKDNWRLGVMLAALEAILGMYAQTMMPPPGIDHLRATRNALAFGWVSLDSAKADVEMVLLGLPHDNRIASKALDLIEFPEEAANLYATIEALYKEQITIAAQYEKATDKAAFLDANRDRLIQIYTSVRHNVATVDTLQKREAALRKRFNLEMEVFARLGWITPIERDTITLKLKSAIGNAVSAAERMKATVAASGPATDALMAAYGGQIKSKSAPLKWKDVMSVVFTD